MQVIAAHPEVSYEIHYRYQGKNYVLTIPAGADLNNIESISNGCVKSVYKTIDITQLLCII